MAAPGGRWLRPLLRRWPPAPDDRSGETTARRAESPRASTSSLTRAPLPSRSRRPPPPSVTSATAASEELEQRVVGAVDHDEEGEGEDGRHKELEEEVAPRPQRGAEVDPDPGATTRRPSPAAASWASWAAAGGGAAAMNALAKFSPEVSQPNTPLYKARDQHAPHRKTNTAESEGRRRAPVVPAVRKGGGGSTRSPAASRRRASVASAAGSPRPLPRAGAPRLRLHVGPPRPWPGPPLDLQLPDAAHLRARRRWDAASALSTLSTGASAAAELESPQLELFFAATDLHVHLLCWEDNAVVEAAISPSRARRRARHHRDGEREDRSLTPPLRHCAPPTTPPIRLLP
uniref:Uncharacterized protein n=1 Tax=Oryza sativa subsp. japonica TaxID=39947 RepID=Q6K7S8_ORYSJ|nr:hypothetical protein [Oryza sativa Japonica Group]BAD21844.1 hypothetical protein [Oryza sativa Japonica Group]